MPASRSASIEPSTTFKVFNALEVADDFLNTAQLMKLTKLNSKQVCTSLVYLQKRQAVINVESNGRLYWAADSSNDNRRRHIDEHRKEDEPRITKHTSRRGAMSPNV